jgi:MFS family permease
MHATAAAYRRRENTVYAALLCLAAIDAAGYSVIAPTLPEIAARTGAGPAAIGAVVASFPAAMIAGFVLAGRAVRRGDRSSLIAASLALSALGCLGFIVGDTLAVVLPARAVMGLGSGGLWIAVTFATLEWWPGQEYLCLSRIFAAYSVGGLVGPAIGTLEGVRAPFTGYLAFILCGLAMCSLLGRSPRRRRFASDRNALQLPGFWFASAGIVFASLALGLVEGVLPLHLGQALTQVQIGSLYVAVSLIAFAAAVLGARFNPRRILLAGVAPVVAGLAAVGASPHVPVWLLALAATAIGIGFANTGSLGVLITAVPPGRIVTAMVVWSQLGIIGYLLGPLAGGALVDSAGYGPLGLLPAAVAAGLLVAAVRTGPTTAGRWTETG